ncbi:hypothetical protein DFH07DRAFT_45013 [Mycena maculata]|uniref:Uncharacterized protein n=1 Tax=Mycena maculata TaxID=230809 RepID=A0AAD7N246_9AGAR|nr:hypothetical protein DFH07DRAFT_45013 [Mycena maculata]
MEIYPALNHFIHRVLRLWIRINFSSLSQKFCPNLRSKLRDGWKNDQGMSSDGFSSLRYFNIAGHPHYQRPSLISSQTPPLKTETSFNPTDFRRRSMALSPSPSPPSTPVCPLHRASSPPSSGAVWSAQGADPASPSSMYLIPREQRRVVKKTLGNRRVYGPSRPLRRAGRLSRRDMNGTGPPADKAPVTRPSTGRRVTSGFQSIKGAKVGAFEKSYRTFTPGNFKAHI